MEFYLYYIGPLPTEPKYLVETKHTIRKSIHEQLSELWSSKELAAFRSPQGPNKPSYIEEIGKKFSLGQFQFVPLVTEDLRLLCHLDILFFRREDAGALITKPKDAYGGDLDNRLKVFLDALRIPTQQQELPAGATPDRNEQPYFYCLLEDDSLVTKFQVESAKLLRPISFDEMALVTDDTFHKMRKNVQLGIKVTTRITMLTLESMRFVTA